MTPIDYLNAVREILNHLERTQLPAVEAAADAVIAGLRQGGNVYCGEIGHGGQGDFINRAGGLIAVNRFVGSVHVQQPVAACRRQREAAGAAARDTANTRAAVAASTLGAGDVLLVSSVSGRNAGPIELTLAVQARGVKVIGFTAMPYTRKVTSNHASGKRLFEVVDLVVDIGAPYGDAGVKIPGYEHPLMPLSGVAMDVAGWMIWGRVMEKMAAAGDAPSVLISQNCDAGPAFNEASRKRFDARGF